MVPPAVIHRHIQQRHLFSSKTIIQFSWFSPLLPFPPSKSHPFLERNTICVLPGSERLCVACFAYLQSLLRFFGFLSSSLVCRNSGVQKFWDNQKTGQLCSSWCGRVILQHPPPKKTKQRKFTEGEEMRRELEEEEKESILGKKFWFQKKGMMHNERSSCLSCKLLPCKVGSSSLCYIIRGVFQISFKAI
jgi:hypothetical protein